MSLKTAARSLSIPSLLLLSGGVHAASTAVAAWTTVSSMPKISAGVSVNGMVLLLGLLLLLGGKPGNGGR